MGKNNVVHFTATPEATAIIKEMHAAGASAGMIADRLGVSRSAIGARKARLGLRNPQKPSATPRKSRAKAAIAERERQRIANEIKRLNVARMAPPKRLRERDPYHPYYIPRVRSAPLAPCPPSVPRPVALTKAGDNDCRAIIGKSADGTTFYCGAVKRISTGPRPSPYCEMHHRLFHVGAGKVCST